MEILITFNEYLEPNSVKRVRKASWLKMDNSIYSHPKFFQTSFNVISFYVFLLVENSKVDIYQNSFTVHKKYISRISKLRSKLADKYLDELCKLGFISVSSVTEVSEKIDDCFKD